MPKRYYWLKLQNDFFKSLRIKKLRRLAGGDTYTIIYLKMQLKCLADGGYWYHKGVFETFEEEVALDIDEELEDVKITIQYLLSCGLMEVTDSPDTYKMPYVIDNIGSEGSSAQRVRDFRKKQALQCNTDVTDVKRIGNVDIEKEIDIDKEIDNARETENADLAFEAFWNLYPKKQARQQAEHEFARALLNDVNLTSDMLITSAFNYAEAVSIEKREERYIKAPNRFISDNTFVEYLPGNYKKPKPKASNNKFLNHEQKDYGDMSELEKELLSYD